MTTSLWARALSALPDKDQRMFRTSGTASAPVSKTLADIITAIETQRDRCKRHKWSTISIGGKELIIRDVCAKIVACVNKFASVVDVVVSYDPVHAALPWAGVRFVLQLFLNGIDTFGAIVEGLETSVRVIARGGILEGLYYQKNSALSEARQALQDEIVKCYTAVLKFLSLARKYYQCSRMKRAVNFISKDDLRHCTKEIQIAEQQFLIQKGLADSEDLGNIETNVLHTILIATSTADQVNDMKTKLEKALLDLDKPLIRVVDQVSDLHRSLKDNERAQILRWISPVPAQEHYREASASLMPGSGEWLFRHPEFQAWRDSSSSEVLWLHGIPGCGKSKIAAAVIRQLRLQASKVQHSLPIVHFFCSTNPAEPERSDAREILRSLMKQLSLSVSKDLMRTPVVEEYRKLLQEATYYGEGPAALSVERCTELLCELGQSAPIMLIIDALDECDSQQRTILQQSLEEMRQSCRDLVKIFVSSRYEEDIATGFRHKRTLCMTPRDTEDDLKHFIDLHVSRFMSRWAVLHSEASDKLQQLEKSLKETLNTGAQGMFLWVSLQLECISDTSRVKDLESIYVALESLPATLGRSYAAIHCRIESMKETAREVARFTFYWLLGAKRMLPIPDFLIAVARSAKCLSNLQPRTIIDYCCGLAVIDNETNTFRLAHPTVREYLESLEIYRGKEVSYSIALACLDAYLGENCVENEFLKYATNYWPSHVEDLGFAPQRAKVVPSLTDFFTKEEHFDDWLDNFELQQREGGSSWKSTNERKLDASISTPRTPLFLICCFGFVEILEDDDVVEDLDVNQTNKDGSSGLYLAARGGHIMVVQKLLDMGANIDAPGFQYGDALQAACLGGWTEIVQLLINHGATSSVPRRGEYSSPLQAALAGDNNPIAEVLLNAGVKLTTQQQFDDAIETAAFKGNVSVFQRLMAGEVGDFTPKIRPDPLQVALAGGKMRRAKLLLQSCADINEEKGLFGNALAAAIASERLSIVQLVLDAGANIELRGRYGFPLRAAVIINNFEITKCLLEKGADPNVIDEELGDALQAAASRGSLAIMSLLLAYKANVRGRGGHFGDTLQAAAFGGHEKAVELLIHHGAKDSLEKPRGRYHSALRAAVYAGHQSIVQRLLEAGARLPSQSRGLSFAYVDYSPSLTVLWQPRDALPNVKEEVKGLDTLHYLGPLEITAQRNDVALLETLLLEGPHYDNSSAYSGSLGSNLCDSENPYTALQIAAFWGHTPTVRCLLAHGVDINMVKPKIEILLSNGADIDRHWTDFGSCLQVFSKRGKLEVVQFLLDRGANINDVGGFNGTALQVACGAGHVEVVQLLLQKGADMNAQGKAIGTALHAASANGHLGIVKMLLHHDAKADIDSAGSNVDTNTHIALQVACANGRREVVEALLDRGAGVRNTLLCRASENGDTSLMQLMLDNGSLVNPETGLPDSKQLEGRSPTDDSSLTATPLHFAAYRGHESAVTFLLDNGADLHVQGILYPMQEQGHHNSDFDFETNTSSPMQAACYKGNSHIAKLLFTHDPWGHIKHQTFTVALKTSLDRGQHEVQRILLLQAVRSGFRAEQFHEAFCHACLKGYTQFVELILEHFTVDNWPDAILQAAEDGRAGIVKALLLHGADPKMRNESGDTAISLAIRKMSPYCCGFYDGDPPRYRKTLAALVEAGHVLDKSLSADIPRKILHIITAYIYISESVEYADVISMLVQNDAQAAHLIRKPFEAAIHLEVVESVRVLIDLFAKNDMHRTEICTSILSQFLPLSMEMLSFLLSQGGDVNTRHFKDGKTLLHRAAARGDEDALRILISYGAQVSLQSSEQGTALHAAAAGGFHGSVNLLLTENAEVDASCTLTGTPLAAVMARKWKSCCGRYHRSCAEQLIAWGADIDRIDERLGTPMDIAYKAGNNEGVELLLENGALDPQSTAYPLNSDN
ncbi:ankyrin repeat-containing domain protein [Aspergillus welwitschiae]|uniref:Ankyrin repeat-containing domain protein n=1 Tax=Aspergillus welwitschiae TaxID=1341132 RepID=A0A3F3QKI8_9EURO|nr:ankyrin repeat-containing domain protein [Aspergillus welwitschiae]RDH39372.1 ankyrin repeat-containing domain protein [Aspergillus welwitschiae]